MTRESLPSQGVLGTLGQPVYMKSAVALLIAASVWMILDAGAGRTVSMWIAGCIVLAIVSLVVLRPFTARMERQVAEAQILGHVRFYLQSSHAEEPRPQGVEKRPVIHCDFRELSRVRAPEAPGSKLVAFGTMPLPARFCEPECGWSVVA